LSLHQVMLHTLFRNFATGNDALGLSSQTIRRSSNCGDTLATEEPVLTHKRRLGCTSAEISSKLAPLSTSSIA